MDKCARNWIERAQMLALPGYKIIVEDGEELKERFEKNKTTEERY
jgi:hypothetical protein